MAVPQPFLSLAPGGATRNTQTGPAGCDFTVGPNPLIVTALGRWTVAGNNQVHYVQLTTGNVGGVPTVLGQVNISTNGLPVGFAYADLLTPIVLTPFVEYAVMSQEYGGGDFNIDASAAPTPTSDATLLGVCFLSGGATGNLTDGARGWGSYGGSTFLYLVQQLQPQIQL